MRRLIWLLNGGVLLLVLIFAAAYWRRQQWRERVPTLTVSTDQSAALREVLAAAHLEALRWPVEDAAVEKLLEICLSNGRWSEAEQLLPLLRELQPAQARWFHAEAVLRANRGDLSGALTLWEKMPGSGWRHGPALVRKADVLVKLNRGAEAVPLYERVLADVVLYPYAEYGLARMELQQGRLEAAEARLRSALARQPDFYGNHALLQAVARQRGDTALAEAEDRELKRLGRFRELIDEWVAVRREFCWEPYLCSIEANLCFSQGEWAQAAAWYERTLSLEPKDANAWRWLGACQVKQGRIEEARRSYLQSIALKPNRPDVYVWLANLEREQGRPAEALPALRQGLADHADHLPLLRAAIFAFMQAGQVAESVPWVERALALDPNDRDLRELLAVLRAQGLAR